MTFINLLNDLNDTLKNLAKTIESHNVSESRQREEKSSAESVAEVRLPVAITKHYETEQRERPKNTKRENKKICIEIVGIIIAGMLAALTGGTLIIYIFQLNQMSYESNPTSRVLCLCKRSNLAACASGTPEDKRLFPDNGGLFRNAGSGGYRRGKGIYHL